MFVSDRESRLFHSNRNSNYRNSASDVRRHLGVGKTTSVLVPGRHARDYIVPVPPPPSDAVYFVLAHW